MLGGERLDLGQRAFEVSVSFDEPADGVRPVLALGGELEVGDGEVGPFRREHDHLGRPGGEVDGDVAGDEQLRLVHERVPRAYDLVHRRDRLRAVGERGDRLRPTDGPDLAQAEELRGSRDDPGMAGGVTTAMRSTPATCAGTAHMTRVDTSRRGT